MAFGGVTNYIQTLQERYDLCVRCNQCTRRGSGKISYSLIGVNHECSENILLVKYKGKGSVWRPVATLPDFPRPHRYDVCWYYSEEHGCKEHGNRCTYARSEEEAALWNFIKDEDLTIPQLVNLIKTNPCSSPEDRTTLEHLTAVERIISVFKGRFVELCKRCFHVVPQKISFKLQNGKCTNGHSWQPLLAYCKKDEQSRDIYTEIRPLPRQQSNIDYCRYVANGEPCRHGDHHCSFAHNKVEMAVWRAERTEGLNRLELLQSKSQDRRQQFYCKLCDRKFTTNEDFMNHCFTLGHRRLIFEDSSFLWKYRDPPPTNKDLKLCARYLTCEYGDSCIEAHSQEELQEWQKRLKAARKRANDAAALGLLSYQDSLLEEYRHSKSKEMIVHDTLPDVSITCEPDLDSVYVRQKGIPYTWNLTIISKVTLEIVALLRHEVGATFTISKDPSVEQSYSTGDWFLSSLTSDDPKVYEIPVSFTSDQPGLYEQWVVFDFDTRPVLQHKLKVRVGESGQEAHECKRTSVRTPAPEVLQEMQSESENARSPKAWNVENVEIIPFGEREQAERELLNKYKLVMKHQLNFQTMAVSSINRGNYKDSMHKFLYQEEKKEAELLTRLQAVVQLTDQLSDDLFGSKYAHQGELFAAVPLIRPLTPNTPQGYILKRHVSRALVHLVENHEYLGLIYEAEVLKDTATETQLHLKLSKRCCADLHLQNGQQCEMVIQFQLNCLGFCEMHKAIDDLPHLDKVLPDLKNSSIPIYCQSETGDLNEKQQAAMNFVLGVTENISSVPPLLIYGPFGTGKTRTLAKMAQALVKQPQNKILICTHTNSSADLYVKNHFHEYVTSGHHEAKPLRIKAKERNPLKSTDPTTLKYCHLSNDGYYFEFPDKAVLDSTRIIITTTSMARSFHDVRLPENYFSHILIDEASQMLECEALMALGLAGKKTRVILAGDHMQMGPKLFSVRQDKCSEHTLLNRLFYHYQAENSNAAKQSRIIFNENYRSAKDILDFVSTHFYVGKTDVIKARGNVPPHPHQHALQFHHVRGECHLDPTSMSWFNQEQIQSVVDIVQGIIRDWPKEWHDQDPASICVLSQGRQVYEIRQRLAQFGLRGITVENAENVQGKQFRVILISTVHTKDSLLVTKQNCFDFFNDMRVLNTVMTRAQSQIFVVGDAAALSSPHFGMCCRLWRSYIEHCINKGSAHDLTQNSLKQDLLEISELCRIEDEDSTDSESSTSEIPDTDDPILKELLDENKYINIALTEEGLFPVFQNEHLDRNVLNHVQPVDSWKLQSNSTTHKCCELVKESFDRGYAIPLDEPSLRINIKGRQNLGQSFPGDKVEVKILSEHSNPLEGKVIDVIDSANTPKEFVCTIERYDSQVMVPINKCISKIHTPFWKDKPFHIAVKNPNNLKIERFIKINEDAHRNYLFVVRVLRWKNVFRYPLGVVVGVFPKIATLQDGLKILDKEFQLSRTLPSTLEKEMQHFQGHHLIENGRKDFRGLQTFTIDPADSQDLDDAISVRDLGECYEIGVHISDVASFVAKDSELDKYARQRGTTFYTPEKETTYMFPEELSTSFFSLIPNHHRRAISLMIEIDKRTDCIKKRSLYKSVICSKRKFSYNEADDIIEKSVNSQHFDHLEVCIVVACHFAEVHRKCRKQEDWCYKPPDEDVTLGRRRSHQMVEELMIMFNHTVAERLLFDEATRSLTPLRCQDRPKSEKMNYLFDKNASLIPLSIHLSCQADASKVDSHKLRSQSLSNLLVDMPNPESAETFPILISLLESLKKAAQTKDIYRIIDLITTDDIHPQLLPFAIAFRRLLHKAYFLRSNSTHAARIGHYDLDLDSYTWASSPIRRYIDVIVQRLLHCVIDKTDQCYRLHDINLSCVEFSRKNDHQSAYERKANALHFASKLSAQSKRKVAYIVELNPSDTNFRISFPLNRASIPDNVGIFYRDLQLADQPEFDETNKSMILTWVRRIYSFSNPHIHAEVKQQNPNSVMAFVPTKTWKCLVDALRAENWELLFRLIEELNISSRSHTGQFQERPYQQNSGIDQFEHYAELSLRLKQGEAVEVQLGTDTARGLMTPAVQLLIVHKKFEICLEHVKDPIKCFSKYALNSSRNSYNKYMHYQTIWKPLCEMESVSNAVAENENIVLKDVALKWDISSEGKLSGGFLLPLDKKDQWSIECDLGNCLLCIRTRIPQKECCPFLKNSQCTDLMDIPIIIWVAHGVITKVEEMKTRGPSNLQIDFQINHMPMTNIPEDIFCESSRFTVELIPKPLPDVRKENAIDSLTKANELVKTIAMGRGINTERDSKSWKQMPARFEIKDLPSGFSHLNNSQCKAIREALINPFTLIQGPPGTGKTVVGVHIVYWLLKKIQTRPSPNPQKKRAILYCGPSNKSVDVVAGHLLKLEKQLGPLRVYSDQMEMLEFPYPGCNLKLSRHSKRVEKPNTELSSIALHHLIRKADNPFSGQILDFDMKIRRGDHLTKEEIKCYKETLQKARKHELLQHDVILCTCTAASHPALAEALDIKQIIIDECAMATEPEAFIPLVAHKPEQIILLGDHMQLQPIVHCDVVKRLGMSKSLFERYMEKALMLDTQYRMQEGICAFPSQEFYEGKLKTAVPHKLSLFHTESRQTPIIFGHVEGKEKSLVVSTERGNENSKANEEEAEEVVRIAKLLTNAGIQAKDIAILTPYNAQVANISESLSNKGMHGITVNTIMKSQGSEWKYIILSTVRSCPKSEIETQPTKSWITNRLGFIVDRNQVNVGITRAQEGLCIIGNENLLRCSFLWRKLLNHYQEKRCVVNPASNIQVLNHHPDRSQRTKKNARK
ncbi:helicase with zinc finger domain 2-like [Myxocyprinus asiaticus]|uniref:helicase with zinc finger domain 2-like n=1 Tax=Myxocyprinus asiaticus TaxID=70543 RepID=UPI002222126C|nr:helicase with zinc finger domain 2-like [Myxocyprinus asiaticus]XP_051562535.1 helicase with zinc finger domain 2-like [Myxocyprinus asiaticus]